MIVSNKTRKIIKYVNKKEPVSYKKLTRHFKKYHGLQDDVDSLIYSEYIASTSDKYTEDGEPTPLTDETMLISTPLGLNEDETHRFFNVEYVLSHIIIPLLIGIIGSFLGAFFQVIL